MPQFNIIQESLANTRNSNEAAILAGKEGITLSLLSVTINLIGKSRDYQNKTI